MYKSIKLILSKLINSNNISIQKINYSTQFKYSTNHQWVKLIEPQQQLQNNGSSNSLLAQIGLTKYATSVIEPSGLNNNNKNKNNNKPFEIQFPVVINDKIEINQPILKIHTKEDEQIQFNSPIEGTVLNVNNNLKKLTTDKQLNNHLDNNNQEENINDTWTIELSITDPNKIKSIFNNCLMNEQEYTHYCEDLDYK